VAPNWEQSRRNEPNMTDVITDALAELKTVLAAESPSRTAVIEWPGEMKSLRSNELISQWRTFGTVQLLGIMPTGGVSRSSEMMEAEGVVSEATFLVETAYLAGVCPRMRLRLPVGAQGASRILYIGFANNLGNRGETWQLYCGETLRT